MLKNAVIIALLGVIAVGGATIALGQPRGDYAETEVVVEVRVWEDTSEPESNYISVRPQGGSWQTLGTIAIPLTDGRSSSGRFRYGDIELTVPVQVDLNEAYLVNTWAPLSVAAVESDGQTKLHAYYSPADRRDTIGVGDLAVRLLVGATWLDYCNLSSLTHGEEFEELGCGPATFERGNLTLVEVAVQNEEWLCWKDYRSTATISLHKCVPPGFLDEQ